MEEKTKIKFLNSHGTNDYLPTGRQVPLCLLCFLSDKLITLLITLLFPSLPHHHITTLPHYHITSSLPHNPFTLPGLFLINSFQLFLPVSPPGICFWKE